MSVVIHPEVQLYLHDEGLSTSCFRNGTQVICRGSICRGSPGYRRLLRCVDDLPRECRRRQSASFGDTSRTRHSCSGTDVVGVSVASPARQAPELRKPRAQPRMTTDTFRCSWFAGGREPAPRQGLAEAVRLSAWGSLTGHAQTAYLITSSARLE